MSLFNFAGQAHLIVDVVGWFPSGSSYTPLQPARLLETRSGLSTIDGLFNGGGGAIPKWHLDPVVVGRGGIPATGVGAVVLNVTVTEPTAAGYVTVFPSGDPRPTASNLNFVAGQTIPNLTIAKVGVGGRVSLFNFAGQAHLIVDIVGWFPEASTPPPAFVTQPSVGAGGSQSCAVRADATVKCWGGNFSGQLGNGTFTNSGTPVTVAGITGATALVAGDQRTCALRVDASIRCWGSPALGDSTSGTPSPYEVAVTGITTATAIAAGGSHTCALLASGAVVCWGSNTVGELGNYGPFSTEPVGVVGITNAIRIAAGGQHSCAVLADATIRCWGSNYFGELGDGSPTFLAVAAPVVSAGITNAVAVAAGGRHSCALLATGTIECWGQNTFGQLGNGTLSDSLTPVTVTGITNALAVTAGLDHSCALLADATIKCWGANFMGQVGNGTTTNTPIPTPVAGINTATAIQAGQLHTCAQLADNSVRCWGYNYWGQLGDGTASDSSTPVTVTGL